MLKISCAMQSGHGRGLCQDRLLLPGRILNEGAYQTEQPARGVYAIMDGVGGIPGGELASTFCAAEMMNLQTDYILEDEGANAVERLEMFISSIDQSLRRMGSMATTMSGILMAKSNVALLFHVGNTRVWGLQGGYLRQLTRDHTQLEMMERQGMDISDAMRQNVGHVITACLGGPEADAEHQVEVEWIAPEKYDAILFTCDGIHEHVDIEELENLLNEEGDLNAAIARARENGSHDDCSIMALRFVKPQPEMKLPAEAEQPFTEVLAENVEMLAQEICSELEKCENGENGENASPAVCDPCAPAGEAKAENPGKSLFGMLFGKK